MHVGSIATPFLKCISQVYARASLSFITNENASPYLVSGQSGFFFRNIPLIIIVYICLTI